MGRPKRTILDILNMTDSTGDCWIWSGPTRGHGFYFDGKQLHRAKQQYPVVQMDGKVADPAIFLCEHITGTPFPEDQILRRSNKACHPLCVNPNHRTVGQKGFRVRYAGKNLPLTEFMKMMEGYSLSDLRETYPKELRHISDEVLKRCIS